MKSGIWSPLSCIAAALLSGCIADGNDDLRQWVQERRMSAKPRVQPLSEPMVFSPQAYIASAGLEPFSAIKLTQVLGRESAQNTSNMALLIAEQNRRKEELEAYPLDAMSMVGSLHKDGQHTALLRVNQLIYQVRQGNYLGQNYGRILEIGEQTIKLREVVQDPAGDWVERVSTLDLQEEKK